jgi:hypothetical protein
VRVSMKYRYFRASLIVIVIAFTCAVGNSPEGTASGPDNGKYCIDNGATMLLVRLGSNGSLEFGMSSWAFRGHYFGVTGLAQPDPSGWRFRENMNAADPRERCETLIARLSDGGYSFSVTQAGRCEANGGVGAPPAPNSKILFPARSRQGEMPQNKPMAEAMSPESGGISCDKPHRGR